jgi:hypothetical protein
LPEMCEIPGLRRNRCIERDELITSTTVGPLIPFDLKKLPIEF